MAKYVKLGRKAKGFSDPYSRFKILLGEIKKLNTPQAKISGKIRSAIKGGHLVVCSEKEFNDYQKSVGLVEKESEKVEKVKEKKEPTLEDNLTVMTNEALNTFYEKTYEVTEKQSKVFKKLNHEDKILELIDLDKED